MERNLRIFSALVTDKVLKPPQAVETSEPPVTSVFRLGPNQMLPAVCPACGALGTQPETLPLAATHGPSPEVDAHFCDICASDRGANRTRHLGFLAACAILVVAVATAVALSLGTRDLVFQIVATAGAGVLLPEILMRTGFWRTESDVVELKRKGGQLLLFCRSRLFSRSLREHGLSEVQQPAEAHASGFRSRKIALGLVGGGLAWLGLVHSLGGAQVRVIVSGKEKAVLLVDARHSGTIAPTNAEDPRAGQSLRVLGGRRQLELISHSGARLGRATRTIWPGLTYIVGQLPPGKCLFWESRKYGRDASRSIIFPVGGEGPIWELDEAVDSWFIPLEEEESQTEAGEADWETSGGIRRAIRLLPCRGGHAR